MDLLSDIMAQLEGRLGTLSGTPEPLDGGITNRNYRATLGGREYVIRRPGKDTELLGIDRRAERDATEAAAQLGLAPDVAGLIGDCLVTAYVPCEPPGRDGMREGIEELAGALRAFHDCGAQLSTRFWVPSLLADYERIVERRGGRVPELYGAAREVAARIERALGRVDRHPCHNDLLPGNIIRSLSAGRLMIVDWEYAGMGEPLFDLGNLSVNNGFDGDEQERLLRAYDGRAPSVARLARLRLMTVLSDAREGAWAVVQQHVSTLDFDFERYGGEHLQRMLEAAARPEFELWLTATEEAADGTAS